MPESAPSRMPRERTSVNAGPGRNTAWRKRLTLLAMCIAQGMILLDVTIVNIALPSIQRELHESSSELEWVISAYALSLAALIPLSGTLGDRCGRHRSAGVAGCGGCHHVGAGAVHPERGVLREGPGRRDRDLGDLCWSRL